MKWWCLFASGFLRCNYYLCLLHHACIQIYFKIQYFITNICTAIGCNDHCMFEGGSKYIFYLLYNIFNANVIFKI